MSRQALEQDKKCLVVRIELATYLSVRSVYGTYKHSIPTKVGTRLASEHRHSRDARRRSAHSI